MVPVAVLPAAGLLMGIAYAISSANGALANPIAALNVISTFIMGAGGSIIDYLPVVFAIGVAFGMSKGATGAAGLAGFVAYNTVVVMLAPKGGAVLGIAVSADAALAFSKIGNALTGIASGVIAAFLYNRFSKTQLPSWLSFFNGKRLVPILASFAMMVYVILMFFIWPVVFGWLVAFGNWMVGLGALGAGLFGFFNRLLIPTGLHHALNNVFWFDTIGIGDLTKFLSGVGEKGVTGMYQAGFFPIMMFGLPAAALAMIHTAKPENKEKTKGIMISAALTAIVVGITEPIEFAFMFAAPVLYVVHAVLTGVSMAVACLFHATAGFGFSAGLVDFVLSIFNPLQNNIWVLVVMGLVFAAIYYFLFRFLIVKFDMKTPGREDDDEATTVAAE
ncbi:MAG: PTS transporter subunit EIIC [Clostridia bacterium]